MPPKPKPKPNADPAPTRSANAADAGINSAGGTTSNGPDAASAAGRRDDDRPMIWLASKSPRRRQLLAEHGFTTNVAVLASGVDDGELEPAPRHVRPDQWAIALAWLKARAAFERLAATLSDSTGGGSEPVTAPTADLHACPRHVVLAADTVVEVEGDLVGQPADIAEARRILDRLNDRPHRVITGVALVECEPMLADGPGAAAILASGSALRPVRRILFADTADVLVGRVSDAAIESYLATNDWRGKAGAYNLSERITAGWPITYVGDPTTIMGLPMGVLGRVLGSRGSHQG